MKRDFLTVSNLLSLSRIVLVVPFLLVMTSSNPSARLWACAIVALGALTDKLDGYFARRLHQETEWGKILDPIADKVGIAAMALTLLVLSAVPAWFVAALLARDLLILLGGLYLKSKRQVVLPSNTAGKWAVNVIALTLLLALIQAPEIVITVLIWISVGMLLLSLGLYVIRFADVIRGENL